MGLRHYTWFHGLLLRMWCAAIWKCKTLSTAESAVACEVKSLARASARGGEIMTGPQIGSTRHHKCFSMRCSARDGIQKRCTCAHCVSVHVVPFQNGLSSMHSVCGIPVDMCTWRSQDDMNTVVAIHNAVNERAWNEVPLATPLPFLCPRVLCRCP
jgi:hypothetical protein